MSGMRAVLVFSLWFPLLAQTFAPGFLSRCAWRLVGYDTAKLTKVLLDAGFEAKSAERIAFRYPGIAAKVNQLRAAGNESWKPVTIYRGLDIPWSEFNPDFRSPHFRKFHFSYDQGLALQYAQNSDRPETTVLEAQVPAFLIKTVYRYVLDADVPLLDQRSVPDITPFLTRVGRVRPEIYEDRLGRERRRSTVQWNAYSRMPSPAR